MSSFKRLKSVVQPRCTRKDIPSVESEIEITELDQSEQAASCSGCQIKRRSPAAVYPYRVRRPMKIFTKVPKKPEIRGYTAFLAVQITDPECHKNLKKFQDVLLSRYPEIHPTITPVSRSHITLFMLGLDVDGVSDAKLNQAKDIIRNTVRRYKDAVKRDITIKLKSVGHFRSTVIYAQAHIGDGYKELYESLVADLKEGGIPLGFDDYENYQPHVSMFKISKVKGKAVRKFVPKTYPEDCYKNHEDVIFGSQKLEAVQLLKLRRSPDDPDDYYVIHETYPITDTQTPVIKSDHDWCCRAWNKKKSQALKRSCDITPSKPSPSSYTNLKLLALGGGTLLALTLIRKYLTKN